HFYKYVAFAAIFVGLVGISFFTNIFQSKNGEKDEVVKVNEEVLRLETGDGQVIPLSDFDQFKNENISDDVQVVKEKNLLRYTSQSVLDESENPEYNTLNVPNGERFELELSDGSYIMLNAGSSLKYPVNFFDKGSRKVYLKGEAFFKASEDAQRPF